MKIMESNSKIKDMVNQDIFVFLPMLTMKVET